MNERQIRAFQQQAIERAVWDAGQIAAAPELFAWLEPEVMIGLSVNK